jgi:hypothetical protein
MCFCRLQYEFWLNKAINSTTRRVETDPIQKSKNGFLKTQCQLTRLRKYIRTEKNEKVDLWSYTENWFYTYIFCLMMIMPMQFLTTPVMISFLGEAYKLIVKYQVPSTNNLLYLAKNRIFLYKKI